MFDCFWVEYCWKNCEKSFAPRVESTFLSTSSVNARWATKKSKINETRIHVALHYTLYKLVLLCVNQSTTIIIVCMGVNAVDHIWLDLVVENRNYVCVSDWPLARLGGLIKSLTSKAVTVYTIELFPSFHLAAQFSQCRRRRRKKSSRPRG